MLIGIIKPRKVRWLLIGSLNKTFGILSLFMGKPFIAREQPTPAEKGVSSHRQGSSIVQVRAES